MQHLPDEEGWGRLMQPLHDALATSSIRTDRLPELHQVSTLSLHALSICLLHMLCVLMFHLLSCLILFFYDTSCVYVWFVPGDQLRANRHSAVYVHSISQNTVPRENTCL